MSYNKAMFHRMAMEMERIADEGKDKLDENDLFVVANALARLMVDADCDEIATTSVELAACRLDGMYEVFQEQPEIMSNLIDLLMDYGHYHAFDNDVCDGWITIY